MRLAVAVGALYLAFIGEDFRRVIKLLFGLNLWVFAASLLLYFVSQMIFVGRWYMLLKVQSIEIGFWAAMRLNFLGLFYNNFLPGSVGGDFLRAWYVTKHTPKRLEAVLSVFVDRFIGIMGLLLMAFACYWFLPSGGIGQGQTGQGRGGFSFTQVIIDYRWFLIVIALILAVGLLVLLATKKGRGLLVRGDSFIRQHGLAAISKARTAVNIYWGKKLALFWALLMTLACQGIFVVSLWLLGTNLGATAHIKHYLVFFPVSWLIGLIPVSIGGTGIVELWLKNAFIQTCAMPGETALALALCQRLLWVVGSLPGAVIHMLGAHLPKDFSIDEDVTVK